MIGNVTYKKLGELVNIRTGKLDANAADENGKYPFFTCASAPLRINTYSYDCECVLIAGNGDLNVKYYNGKFDAYQRTYIIEKKPEVDSILTYYIYHFFQVYIEVLRRGSIGGIIKYIKLGDLTNAMIPVPSLEDQQRIVRELDAIHAILAAKSEQLRELDKLAEAIFYDMFGDPITNEKGWEIKNLGDICLVKGRIGFRGYTRNDFVETAEEGAISLSPTNIINGHMDFSKCSYVTWDKYNESPEIIVREGDILLVKTGSSYGKCAYVDSLPHESTINPQFVVIKELKIDGRYLTAYLQSEAAKIKYEGFVLGTAIPTFSQKSLNSMPVLCPPLDLQQAFASKISAIEQQKELIRASIAETEALLAARMQHYFD